MHTNGVRPEAYAAGCLTTVAARGAAHGTSGDLVRIFRRSFRGRPSLRQLVEFPGRVATQKRRARRGR